MINTAYIFASFASSHCVLPEHVHTVLSLVHAPAERAMTPARMPGPSFIARCASLARFCAAAGVSAASGAMTTAVRGFAQSAGPLPEGHMQARRGLTRAPDDLPDIEPGNLGEQVAVPVPLAQLDLP